MPVKMTGAEWLQFILDPAAWANESYYDDAIIEVNGVRHGEGSDFDLSAVASGDTVVIHQGYIVKGGACNSADTVSLEDHYNAWRKSDTNMFFAVECPAEKYGAVLAAIKAAGGKIRN